MRAFRTMTETLLTFRRPARHWTTLLGLAAAAVLATSPLAIPDLPRPLALLLATLGLTGIAAALAALALNPVRGLTITTDRITIDPEGRARTIPLAEADHLEIASFTDGRDATLVLKSGERLPLTLRAPGVETLAAALARAGVPRRDG
jgi:hypothetical protein